MTLQLTIVLEQTQPNLSNQFTLRRTQYFSYLSLYQSSSNVPQVGVFLVLSARASENGAQASWDHTFLRFWINFCSYALPRVARNRALPDHQAWNAVVRVAKDGPTPLQQPRWWWRSMDPAKKISGCQMSRRKPTARKPAGLNRLNLSNRIFARSLGFHI